MSEPIPRKIKQCINAVDGLYYRLVLLVGETGSGKTGVLRSLADELGSEIININLAISAELLELTDKQRVLRLPEILDRFTEGAQAPVVLDNLEILFDKQLQQDPLRLLQKISRNRVVVASWSGTVNKGYLLYAEAGHHEYRRYESVDAMIVRMDGMESDESIKGKREAE
jgi:hypothetical protein